jgi:two-component system sensor histidine kinase YesM
MAFKLERLMEEYRKEQENLKKSELRALQAQITPHFLYNTLDAIVWLAEAGHTQRVIEITNAMSDFFRISLNNGKDWVSIGEEWEHLQGYLTIQKIRYRDILRYELEIDGELRQYQMLKLLIQPLVENAIYHGIKNRRSGGTVRVTAKQLDNRLCVSVADNGVGMNDERLAALRSTLAASEWTEAGEGYGLFSVDKRIKLYYSQEIGLTIESEPDGGTRVGFSVPLREVSGSSLT